MPPHQEMKIEPPQLNCTQDLSASLTQDYRAAVVHVAWERKQQDRTLLLAWVELLPWEIPEPPVDKEVRTRIGDSYLYVRHAVTTAARALSWYRDCAAGVAVRPANDGSLPDHGPDVGTMAVFPFDEEPRWPNLVCSRSPVLPFLANWYVCPRVHHLLATGVDLTQRWTEHHRDRATRWLAGQLHFSLADHEALWGSVHLVAPNPVFRRLARRLESSPDGTRETILLHLQARAGQNVAGLQLRFIEERPTGICISKQVVLTGPTLSLEFDHILHQTAVEVHDSLRGLLWYEPAAHFLRHVVMQGSVGIGKRVIRDQRGASMEVPLKVDLALTSVGAPSQIRSTSAVVRLAEATSAHARSADHRRLLQRWFNGQHQEAVEAVHNLISDASREVLIVDPYFARPELKFAVALSRIRVPASVLTSNDGLIERECQGESMEDFVASVDKLLATPNTNPLDVRVMAGAGIHDRFLVIDGRVFLLGSSLNKFGDRGTMMIQLHDSDPVRIELFDEFARGKLLKQWLSDRRAAQQTRATAPAAVP